MRYNLFIMPIDPMTGAKIVGTGVAVATDAQKRKLLADALKAIRRQLHGKKVGIGVFGAGGVGKTTLGVFLDEKFDPKVSPKPYKSSPDTETYYLKSNDAQSLFVAPGQEDRIKYWYGLLDQLSRYKRVIIINIVSYGHHAVERKIFDYSKHVSDSQHREQLLWVELLNALKTYQMPLSLVTVVTKQDLWWHEKETVKSHYESGEYAKSLGDLLALKGSQNLTHEYLYASLVVQNLRDTEGNILMPNASGYDGVELYNAKERMAEILERLAS
jgi:hypothetical protein